MMSFLICSFEKGLSLHKVVFVLKDGIWMTCGVIQTVGVFVGCNVGKLEGWFVG